MVSCRGPGQTAQGESKCDNVNMPGDAISGRRVAHKLWSRHAKRRSICLASDPAMMAGAPVSEAEIIACGGCGSDPWIQRAPAAESCGVHALFDIMELAHNLISLFLTNQTKKLPIILNRRNVT